MSSTPPRNPNSNSNSGPPPLTRSRVSRVSGIIADDETPEVDLTPLPISFPSLEINANNNNQSLTSNAPLTSNAYLEELKKQLKSPELSQQEKYILIFESDLSDEVKKGLRDTHIFDPELLVLGKEVGGTKRRKTKRRKYKKNIIKKRKTKKRKYKK